MRSRGEGDLVVAYLFLSHMMSVVPVAQEGCCAPELKIWGEGDEKLCHLQADLQKRKLLKDRL